MKVEKGGKSSYCQFKEDKRFGLGVVKNFGMMNKPILEEKGGHTFAGIFKNDRYALGVFTNINDGWVYKGQLLQGRLEGFGELT